MRLKEKIPHLLNELKEMDLASALQYISMYFPGEVAFSSALGQEDQAIAHAIFVNHLPIKVFSLDTGRLFQETYALWSETEEKYRHKIEAYFPEARQVEDYVASKGINSFYDSVENRKLCCNIRKVQPLARALKGSKIWITGLRANQSENRQQFQMLEWDETFQVIKFNPVINWGYEEMLDYLHKNEVPYNKLHGQGFISIGCAPCTRAVAPGEDARAGRWWWEQSKKECGLHANYFDKKTG